MNMGKPVVAHSVATWLPLTMTWVYNQLKYMKNFSLIVLAYTTQNRDQFPWNPIYSITNKYNCFVFRVMRKLGLRSNPFIYDKAIKKNHPVILHSHFGDIGWYDLPIAKKYELKHVVTFYGFDISMLPTQHPIWGKRYKKLFDKADLFLCEGSHMVQCILDLGCPEHKVRVHHLGVSLDEIQFKPRVWNSTIPLRILIVSTFREKKGIPYALEALGQFQHAVDLNITIIGDATSEHRDQVEKQKIFSIIKKYNLQPRVRFLGFQRHSVVLDEAYNHHIFLSPSITASNGDTEGGVPVTIIEMVATGIPVISTVHCDIPEVIHHGVSGLLAQERDVNGLVNHLKWLVDHYEHWRSMLEAGRKHLEVEYDVRKQGERLAIIYRDLIQS
jgi:colanic acid/amylovoran biosynthesis glycosyltransferase